MSISTSFFISASPTFSGMVLLITVIVLEIHFDESSCGGKPSPAMIMLRLKQDQLDGAVCFPMIKLEELHLYDRSLSLEPDQTVWQTSQGCCYWWKLRISHCTKGSLKTIKAQSPIISGSPQILLNQKSPFCLYEEKKQRSSSSPQQKLLTH